VPDLLLLDTHIWIWLFEGVEREIPRGIKQTLRSASMESALVVSAMSVWELGMLEVRGRVRLSMDCRVWVQRALGAPGLRFQGLTPAIAIESTRLPGVVHGDTVDRILIATARLIGAVLVTRDHRILDYAETGQVRALRATP
jgi:PIN domain nuclease of toxin-antitoxin system